MGSGAAEKSTKQSRAEGKAGNMREKHRRGVCAIKKVCSDREERRVGRDRQRQAGNMLYTTPTQIVVPDCAMYR